MFLVVHLQRIYNQIYFKFKAGATEGKFVGYKTPVIASHCYLISIKLRRFGGYCFAVVFFLMEANESYTYLAIEEILQQQGTVEKSSSPKEKKRKT